MVVLAFFLFFFYFCLLCPPWFYQFLPSRYCIALHCIGLDGSVRSISHWPVWRGSERQLARARREWAGVWATGQFEGGVRCQGPRPVWGNWPVWGVRATGQFEVGVRCEGPRLQITGPASGKYQHHGPDWQEAGQENVGGGQTRTDTTGRRLTPHVLSLYGWPSHLPCLERSHTGDTDPAWLEWQ